jgi:hypothetical protein
MAKIIQLETEIFVAPQLVEADFAEIAALGFRSVVNSRPDDEAADQLPNVRAILLAAYSGGIAVPFLAAALLTGPFLRLMTRFRRHLGLVEKVMGGALVATGLLIFFDAMPEIGAWLQEHLPFIRKIG